MTAVELAKWVNRHAHFTVGELTFTVTTHDAKPRFGQTSVLVRPVDGSGEQWVDSGRLVLIGRHALV